MNGVDNAAQLWNKHFHYFMDREGFVRTSRDNCIYTHPQLSVQSSLYVDDILASADPDKKHQLDLFVRKVQKQFSVRLLGEPTKFLGMHGDHVHDHERARTLLCFPANIHRDIGECFPERP